MSWRFLTNTSLQYRYRLSSEWKLDRMGKLFGLQYYLWSWYSNTSSYSVIRKTLIFTASLRFRFDIVTIHKISMNYVSDKHCKRPHAMKMQHVLVCVIQFEGKDRLSDEFTVVAAGVWGTWANWSACSGSCGMGIRVR